jgi:hypothetical protein
MKRSLFLAFAVIAFVLVATPEAQAICQTCVHDSPSDQRCVVVDPYGDYAEYAACWEQVILDPCGDPIGDYCTGSPAGSDCNLWQSGGGGGGTGDPYNRDMNGDGGTCSGVGGCSAECARCGNW